jgi:hypothetical protein
VLFSTYGEWQSWEAFNAHLDSEHVKAWLTFLADNKVAFTWYSLGTPGNDVRPEPEPSNGECRGRLRAACATDVLPPVRGARGPWSDPAYPLQNSAIRAGWLP